MQNKKAGKTVLTDQQEHFESHLDVVWYIFDKYFLFIQTLEYINVQVSKKVHVSKCSIHIAKLTLYLVEFGAKCDPFALSWYSNTNNNWPHATVLLYYKFCLSGHQPYRLYKCGVEYLCKWFLLIPYPCKFSNIALKSLNT